jgi:hypothetical protein
MDAKRAIKTPQAYGFARPMYNPSLDVERMYAKRMKAVTEEVAGSHVAFISHPDIAAHIIEEAAKGVGAPN